MELPLVVGVDGSESSLRAVDWATDEAALRGVPLRLVYASLWERYEGAALVEGLDRSPEQVMADNVMEAAAQRAHRRAPEVKVTTDVLPDDAVSVLLNEAHTAAALVVGSRGRSGLTELLLGSVSLTVAGRAACPVIVLRGNRDNQARAGTHRRVVLGVGEGPHGTAATRFAFEEAEVRKAALDSVRAWRCPAYESTDDPLLAGEPARLHEQRAAEILESALSEAAAEHPIVELRRRTAEGSVRRVLLDASDNADLLVVGVRRHHGLAGLQLGRVAHTLLHHSACPVAVVPQRG
ncbi:universal stress protein [Streptomyces sp. NBC_01728]|uniref:universal stress protein n=1 Tax=unclassified Streptomyces TaxID=2593676 RepID=UPI002258828A|nr:MULTISPECIES: universal stress protein [unclassified Streptomyces]MCX4462080.1 universal stress protein [Streptomyces sp. NBC_01719]MCX4490988.1 universal stress protein [Streptomyces sp. NBC_01728]MCX4594422.1 universal stress protein [Streptomyces sp. NBC_01549]